MILLKIFHYGLLQICPDRNFHSFQTFFPNRSKILLKIVITWAKILCKIVIMVHCGHVQTRNFTFYKKFCLSYNFAQNCHFGALRTHPDRKFHFFQTTLPDQRFCKKLSKILIKLVILWCESAREVNNRLTGWAFAHLVNYFTHPVN